MALTFIGAMVACLAVLYLPGYLLARSFPFSRFASAALAPTFSILGLTLLGVAAYELVNPCPAPALAGALIALCLAVYLICRIVRNVTVKACDRSSSDSNDASNVRANRTPSTELIPIPADARIWKAAALYIGVALVITSIVFLGALDGFDSFSRNDDTTVHLSVARGFLDTGTFSTLHTSSFLNQGEVGSFYPAAWHVLVAVVASLFGNDVSLATNAAIAVFNIAVFPLAICLLIWRLFGKKRTIILSGALFSVAFSGFPWGFVVFGQLLPNMISFMMVPLALVPFMEALDAPHASDKAKLLLAAVVGLCAVAIAQPNGAFTFGILAVLYAISRVFFEPGAQRATVDAKRVAIAIVVFAAACALWGAMYLAPFMQAVVNTTWSATLSPLEAIISGPLFMFTVRQGVQPFLSVMVLVGIVYTCRHRRHLWLSVAYLAVLAFYVISVSTDGAVKQILTGFWYTDYNRTGALAALFAIPLAAVGFANCVAWLKGLLEKRMSKDRARIAPASKDEGAIVGTPSNPAASDAVSRTVASANASFTRTGAIAAATMTALSILCQFLPLSVGYGDRQIHLGLVNINQEISTRYSWDQTLTSEEDAFIDKVMEAIPEDAMVINVPSDGSCWSYGVEGLNTFYRRSSNTGSRDDVQEAELIRTQLCNVTTNEEVQQTLEDLDARYVMLLDDPSGDNPTKLSLRYEEKNWTGIETITEDTPGFNLILSEGDMRLYEIEH